MLLPVAIYWMYPAFPSLAELEAPLRNILEGCLKRTKLTNHVANRLVLTKGYWTDDRMMT